VTRNDEIRSLRKAEWSVKDIAAKFNLSTNRIYHILNPGIEKRHKAKVKRERAEGIARRADTMDELCIGTKALVRRRYYDPEFKKRMDEYLAEETYEELMMRSRANPDYWQKHW